MLKKRSRYKILWGGRGGAKSHSIARMLIRIMRAKRTRIVCGREVQKSIKESIKYLFDMIISEYDLDQEFTSTDTYIKHNTTGSEVKFIGLQDHKSQDVKGLESVDIFWGDEANQFTKKTLKFLVPTIRKAKSEIWLSWNPELPTDAVDQRFLPNGKVHNAIYINVNWNDNRFLSDEAIQEKDDCFKDDPEEFHHVWEGGYRSASDKQLVSYKKIYESIDRDVEIINAPVIGGADPAREGDDEFSFWLRKGYQVLFGKHWKKVDDFFPVAQEIAKEAIKRDCKVISVDKVGMGEGFVDILKKACGNQIAVSVFDAGASAKDSYYFNKRSESWDLFADWIKEGGKLPNDKTLISDIASITYKFNNKSTQKQITPKDLIKKEFGKSPDRGDALMMTFDPKIDNILNKKPKKKQVKRKWQE